MRSDLMPLVGQRVTITSRHSSSTWTGKLVAITDQPTLILDQADGTRMVLPQTYAITPANDPPPEPSQPMPAEPPRKPNAQWERLAIREPNGEVTYTWPNVPPTADIVAGTRVHGLLDRQLDRLAETLFNSIDRLEQRIEQRAQELAQPAIAQARADVEEAQEERDQWRDRFTDLQGEHQRQFQVVERRAVRAETGIARARATLALNAQLQADDPGYQACADHVRAALHDTDQQEADRG